MRKYSSFLKVFIIFSWFIILPFSLVAQTSKVIEGSVTDMETNEPLPFVTVAEKGTTNGTVTDINGKYSIIVSNQEAVLIYSYVGYRSEEIIVEGKNEIDVSLSPFIEQLDEVVVIGYGTTKKSDLTGALVSISSNEMKDSRTMGVEQALQGRAAGVQITSNSGAPGAGLSVRVRGIGSLNSGMQPLYVIDGFIMGDQSFGKAGSVTPDVYDPTVPRLNNPGLPNWNYLERSPAAGNPVIY